MDQAMAFYKITRLPTNGFVVKDGFHDNVFAATDIDDALAFVREKLTRQPAPVRPIDDVAGQAKAIRAAVANIRDHYERYT